MDIFTVAQIISTVALALVAIIHRKRWRFILSLFLALTIILTALIKEKRYQIKEERYQNEIGYLIKITEKTEKRIEKLYDLLAVEVMAAPREVSPALIPTPTGGIQITSPLDGSEAPARAYIEGSVSAPKAKVWVIVHPMGTSAYWVQPLTTVRRDGTWKVKVYLGRSGNLDIGEQFEIMAVTKPTKDLSEGEVLGKWPESQWTSNVIIVTRK